jgi:hypothetical protein
LKNILAILGAVMGLLIWIGINKISAGFENVSPGVTDLSFFENSLIINPVMKYLPSGWGALAVLNFASGNWAVSFPYLLLLILFSFALGLLAIKTISILHHDGVISEFYGESVIYSNDSPPTGSALIAHIKRDIILLYREYNVLMSSLIIFVLLVLFPLVVGDQYSSKVYSSYLSPPFLIFAVMLGNQIGSRLIPLEKLAFWWNLATPNGPRLLLMSKIITGLLFVTLLGGLAGVIHRLMGIAGEFSEIFVVIGSAWGGFAIGMPIGAYFPRFNWDNPNRMLTGGGIFIYILSLIIVLLPFIGIYILIESFFRDMINPGIIIMLLSVFLLLISMLVTSRKLLNFEWKPDV